MPIRYIKDRPNVQREFDDYESDLSVLLFDPVLERSALPLADRLRRIDPSIRGNADLIVIRGNTSDSLASLNADSILQKVVGNKPIFLLAPQKGKSDSGEFQLTMGLSQPSWSMPYDGRLPSINVLREAEMLGILESSEAVFEGNDDHHFILPAGQHAEQFIRLANALRDPVDVSRVADWLIGLVKPNCLLLADTGTISALLFAVQIKVLKEAGWSTAIDALDGYPGDLEGINRAIQEANNQLGFLCSRLLLVVSVNSSGRLIRNFRSLALQEAAVVIVCDTAQESTASTDDGWTQVLAHYPIKRWDANETGICERCGQVQRTAIHPRTYERIENRESKLVSINWRDAESHRAFWECADRVSAVRLHVDVPYDEDEGLHSRHFGVHLDIPRLIADREFREICLKNIRLIVKPDRVIIPRHSASESIADLMQEGLSVNGSAYERNRILIVDSGRLEEHVVRSIANHARVLIADDALVGGATLNGLRTELYRATQQNTVTPIVEAFVVIARPSDDATLESVKRRYRDTRSNTTRNIHFAELIFLPRGGTADHSCPWCYEAELIRLYLPKLQGIARQYAEERVNQLRGGLFPRLPADRGDLDESLLVTRDSFFGELHRPAAFAAGQSVAQEFVVRVQDHKPGDPIKVLDAKMLIDCFFENVLLGAILRTVPTRLINWRGQDDLVARTIRAINTERILSGTLAELGWAAILGKLPRSAVADLLARGHETVPPIQMMKDILRLQLVP